MGTSNLSNGGGGVGAVGSPNTPSPLCRCRVLYIGSAVPTVTKDGLQGIQQPLRERYPASENPEARGIDSWLSVWYNGLLLEYVDGEKSTGSAFFPINSLHYCAAVRYVNMGGFAVEGGGERFIPLDSPFALNAESPHPPIFAAIFRRTTGVKVLECHGFVCTNERAANALVRCCFHAYADTMFLKVDEKFPVLLGGASSGGPKAIAESPASRSASPSSELNLSEQQQENGERGGAGSGGGTADFVQLALPVVEGTPEWNERAIDQGVWKRRQHSGGGGGGEYDASSVGSSSMAAAKNIGRQHQGGGVTQEAGVLVPYGSAENGRRQMEQQQHFAGLPPAPLLPPFLHHPPPPGMAFFPGIPTPPPPPHFAFLCAPPPGHQHMAAFGAPPHFMPPPPHFFPPRPYFGRIAMPPPPPFLMRPMFMGPPPPSHFLGGGQHTLPAGFHNPFTPPERPNSGPIITETAYDTYPRHNRATYEEPTYMPSANKTVPPQASYKPGSFSPELYEHYYETYRQHRAGERKNMLSRSNSDTSADYWENGTEANNSAFRKTRAQQNIVLPAEGSSQRREGGGGGTMQRGGEKKRSRRRSFDAKSCGADSNGYAKVQRGKCCRWRSRK